MSQLLGFALKGFGSLAAQPAGGAGGASIQHSLAISIRDDIRSLIAAGTLTGIVADSVQERAVPSLRDFTRNGPTPAERNLPAILVVHPKIPDSAEPHDNRRDELSFPVLIAIVANTGQDLDADDATWFGWRETIIAQYRTKGYTIGSPATFFHRCRVEPGPVHEWDWFKSGLFNSWFVLRFYTLQARPTT